MRPRSLITGQKFGRLLVIQEIEKAVRGRIFCLCLCDCGNLSKPSKAHLLSGQSRSCGCWDAERKKLLGELQHKQDWRALAVIKRFGIEGYQRKLKQSRADEGVPDTQ